MIERVAIETRAVLSDAAAEIIRGALIESLTLRDAIVEDDHDSRYLHPARTIRIMIADGECRSVDALAAAAFVDTVDRELVPPPPDRLHAITAAVPAPFAGEPDAGEPDAEEPDPHDDQLLERLVTADIHVGLIAVAERLDHARHIHLRNDIDRPSFHAEVRSVYAPAARRIAAPIARRLDRWADAFERRLILPR